MQKKLITVIAHPIKDLNRYKSFLLLMLLVSMVDQTIKFLKSSCHLNLKLPPFWRISADASALMLYQFPETIFKKVGAPSLLIVIAALFFAKKVISLWPASDMRQMHRGQRGPFGLLAAVGAIGWRQLLWYLVALLVWCGVIAGWCAICYGICRLGWQHHPGGGWLWGFGISVALAAPLMLAGLCFSSRLAVQATGSHLQKAGLLFKTMTCWHVAWRAWLFYLAGLVLEALFISGTTIYILAEIDQRAIRFVMASLMAAPFYAYLEMASFKLFLVAYEKFPLVQMEYERYYGLHRL